MKENQEKDEFLRQLSDFPSKNSTEAVCKARLLQFLETCGPGAFGREIVAGWGHITSAAHIENHQKSQILLVFGAKEGFWKRPDAHIENSHIENSNIDTDPIRTAWQIAEKAVGNANLSGGEIISLSQRQIEAYWNTPAHFHLEIVFGFIAEKETELPRGARWFPTVEAKKLLEKRR